MKKIFAASILLLAVAALNAQSNTPKINTYPPLEDLSAQVDNTKNSLKGKLMPKKKTLASDQFTVERNAFLEGYKKNFPAFAATVEKHISAGSHAALAKMMDSKDITQNQMFYIIYALKNKTTKHNYLSNYVNGRFEHLCALANKINTLTSVPAPKGYNVKTDPYLFSADILNDYGVHDPEYIRQMQSVRPPIY